MNSQPDEDVETVLCPKGCGRSFNIQALAKHSKICEKVFQKKRKQFNTQQQREIEQNQMTKPKGTKNSKNTKKTEPPKKKSTWKQESA